MLISIALLSVVMLALGTALRSAAQSESRIDQRLARSDEFRTANAFIHAVLGRISTRKVVGMVPAGLSTVMFSGGPDRLAWVGIMPARNGTGGRHFFTLGVEPVEGGAQGLVIRYTPWTDRTTFPDWSAADARVLVAAVERFSLRYESVAGEWTSQWTDSDAAPRRVVLAVDAETGPWPDLAIALRTAGTAGSGSGFVIGGTVE